jgi:hypothetical protein
MSLPVEVLTQLDAMPDQLEKCWRQFPARLAGWEPSSWDGFPAEHFSPLGQICHLRDIETDGYLVRFRRVLEEDHPFLASVDGDRLAAERRYSEASPEQALAEFRRARGQTTTLLRAVDSRQAQRRAEFEDYGEVTLVGLAHFLCSHDQQHLSGLQWLLGKIQSLPAR